MHRSFQKIAILILVISGCSPVVTTNTSTVETYSEDLSSHRPTFEKPDLSGNDSVSNTIEEKTYPEPSNDVTDQVNMVLDSINRLRGNVSYVDGFTIQVYSGTSSDEAKLARGKVISTIKESKPTLKYDEPNFKVKVGKYYSRIEAQKTFVQLKRKFPNCIIIPEKIYLEDID